jgi:hypothetical protein
MRETTKKYIKYYSKLGYECATGALFWSAIIGFVYLNTVYANVYGNEQTHDK